MSDETLVLASETVAFLIVVFVLYRYVWPLVAGMARGRQEAIQQQVDDAVDAARRLAQAQRRFDAAVAEARVEVARIRDDARADAHRLREELAEQAQREVERIRRSGEEQLAAQRDQIVRRLRAEIAEMALVQAQRLVVESMSDERRRSATVDGLLDDLARLSTRSSTTVAPAGRN